MRPTSFWREVLVRRAAEHEEPALDLSKPVHFETEEERRAAIKFFNAAYRAEESGFEQAHELASAASAWDSDLAEVLRLYGNEEGWHRELLVGFLQHIGGDVEPMGRVTRTFSSLYGRAHRMDTILLTNLMFETIGATTYRLALGRVKDPAVRQMLIVLTRDEAFHVPLNVHFLKRVLAEDGDEPRLALRLLYRVLFVALVALPLASRPKAKAFDRIGTLELSRAYAEQLARVFSKGSGLPFEVPTFLLLALGARVPQGDDPSVTSPLAAERAADRASVEVSAL